jgi:hypothetical protein
MFNLFLLVAIGQKKQKSILLKKNFIPWSNLEKDGKHYCPLCGKEYTPKDFKKLPQKLSLSVWHDNNLDPEYFKSKIADISDDELFESIDWKKVPKQKSKSEITAALKMLINELEQKNDNGRFYGYNQFDENAFITSDEYRLLMKKDTSKFNMLIKNAESVIKYDIPYGTRHFKFDNMIDFDYNFGESAKYGFHYWGWGYYLTCAYMLKADKRYIEIFDAMFNRWYEQRNNIKNTLTEYDVVWYELGIAARLPMFIDAFRLFENQPELKEATKEKMIKIFLGSGRWLYEAIKRNPYHPYNWPIHTAISEAYLALTFPEFKESKNWLLVSKKVMEEHLAQDVYDDGGYLERTPGYSLGVFNHFYRYLSLFKFFDNDKKYFNKHLPTIEKMAEFQMLTMSPLGTCCPFNDSFRSRMIDFIIKHGKELKRKDFIGTIESLVSEEELKQTNLRPEHPKINSINLKDSKFAVMRSDWSKNALVMIINYGPAANHNHEDILDFEIYANGKAIAVDAGLGPKGYDDELHLNWYRATKSHNMIMVNDSSIMRGESIGENVIWTTQKYIDYFSASHSGYKQKFGITNKRQILFVKPFYWLIFDNVISEKKGHKLDWMFHSPLDFEECENGYRSKDIPGTLLLFADNSMNKVNKYKKYGMADLTGLYDENKEFREINYVSFQKIASTNIDDNNFGVLVFPFKEKTSDVKFNQLKTLPEIIGYEVKYSGLVDRIFFSNGERKKISDEIESDAQMIYIQKKEDKNIKISVVGASFLKIDGKMILNEKKRKNFEKDL